MSEYKVKDRSAKVAKRRNAMKVNGRSVFVVQAVIAKKGREAEARLTRRPSVDKNHGKMGHLCSTLCGARDFA